MILRRLNPADWAAFRDVRLDMLSRSPEAFGSSYDDWARKSGAEIRAWLFQLHALAVIEGDRIQATVAFARQQRSQTRHRADIVSVYARPEVRGQGHVTALLERLASDAAEVGIKQLELHVAAENDPAISLYRRLGFTEFGRIPRAVCRGGLYTDDLLMLKRLDAA